MQNFILGLPRENSKPTQIVLHESIIATSFAHYSGPKQRTPPLFPSQPFKTRPSVYPETPVHGSRAERIVPNNPGELSPTSEFVFHLLNTLPRHRHHFNVAMDNYVVSLRLFRYLRNEFNMGVYGTLRSGTISNSAIDVPSTIILPYHFLTGEGIEKDVLALTWMDNAPVKLLRAIHQATGPTALKSVLRKGPSVRHCRGPGESLDADISRDKMGTLS
jgi:hypothetical protein